MMKAAPTARAGLRNCGIKDPPPLVMLVMLVGLKSYIRVNTGQTQTREVVEKVFTHSFGALQKCRSATKEWQMSDLSSQELLTAKKRGGWVLWVRWLRSARPIQGYQAEKLSGSSNISVTKAAIADRSDLVRVTWAKRECPFKDSTTAAIPSWRPTRRLSR